VHLDGATSAATLLQAAQLRNLSLPWIGIPSAKWQIEALLLAHPGFGAFDVVNDIVGGCEASLSLAAAAFVDDQASNNITYTEVRYDPFRAARSAYANSTIQLDAAVRAVQRGLERGMRRNPGTRVYQLLCAMRSNPAHQCSAVADIAARLRSDTAGGVVGIDLAGDEFFGHDNAPFVACFLRAKEQLGLNTTVHVGETLPWPFPRQHTAADVYTAVIQMKADRLGHGYAAAHDATILAAIRNSAVHVEACPTTASGEGSLPALAAFKAAHLSFGLSRDDPCMGCSETPRALRVDEQMVVRQLHFTERELARAHEEAYTHRFGP